MSREHDIHVFGPDEDNEFSVWLDTICGKMDGVCLSVGSTREAALHAAEIALRLALKDVEWKQEERPHEP